MNACATNAEQSRPTLVDLTARSALVGLIASDSIPLDLGATTRELVVVENEGIAIDIATTATGVRVARAVRSRSGVPRPPHLINYRAIIRALAAVGVRTILSTSTVGSLQRQITPGSLLAPDQMVLWSNVIHTTFTAHEFGFADMTNPYCGRLRSALIAAGQRRRIAVGTSGTYFSVAGPRYETAAEAAIFGRLGGSVVGMTNGPECVIARELGLCYANLSLVTNFAAGLSQAVEIEHVKYAARAHATEVAAVVLGALDQIAASDDCPCSKRPTLFGPDRQKARQR